MSKKKLIIIGANNFQLPLILKAKEMDMETHVFAWEKGAVGKEFADYFYPVSITDKDEIFRMAKKIKPHGVLSIGSDLAAITVNYLANCLNLTGNSIHCTHLTTNKYLMRQALSLNGLPCPQFYFVKNADDTDKYEISFPAIVKPTDRSGSRAVTKVIKHDQLEEAVKRALKESFAKEAIIEEFIEGQEYSIEMITWKGTHHFLQITEKETSGPPYFVEKSQHQPADNTANIKQEVIDLVKKALTALDVQYGASHTEIMITREGNIYFTEVGARMGGDYIGSDLVQLSTGYDFVRATIEIAMGSFSGVQIPENSHSGVHYSFAPEGKVVKIIDNTTHHPDIVRKEIYCDIGHCLPQITESNHRPACFIYKNKEKRPVFPENVIEVITHP